MEKEEKFLDAMEKDIMDGNIPELEKNKLLKNLIHLKDQELNIMITGATGCGKSSTINAMFNAERAKVGVGVDPETMDIKCYVLDNLILWDSPGLGDGREKDRAHSKNIIDKLNQLDKNGNPLIDLVLVILDGGSRDLGTSYELINSVIIPNLGKDKKNRILIAINQADMAMKGKNWNEEENRPEPPLVKFLEEKADSVRRRVKEATGVDTEPIYYCAGYKEEGKEQCKPYNLSKLLYYIVTYTPKEKRVVYIDHINRDKKMWEDDDKIIEYNKETSNKLISSVREYAMKGADIGGDIGEAFFGKAGKFVGKALGGIAGGIVGGIKSLFGF